MHWDWVLTAYWVCLLVGIGYTAISFILGGLTGHDAGFGHAGGGDFSHDYGVGHGGHGEASSSNDAGAVIFGPFSPLVIAFFLTSFGAAGIVCTSVFHLPMPFSLPIAVLAAFLLAWALIKVFNRLLGGMQVSSEVRVYALIGCEGEVTVDIPANGVGEIAYVAMGSRYVAPARSEDPVTIRRFSGVRITRMVGNMFYVRPLVEEQLRELDAVTTPSDAEKPATNA